MTSPNPIGDELHTQIQYRLMEELAASEARYRQLVENLNEIVFEIDRQGHLNFLNRVWTKTLGHDVDIARNCPLTAFVHDDDRQLIDSIIHSILHENHSIKTELRFLHQDGTTVWFEISAQPNGKGGASGVLMDISDRKQATAQLHYLAYHDSLTGLPNRLSFVRCLEHAISRVKTNPDLCFAVLFLDLDGFKLVNDSLGHLVGDRLLIEIAERLQQCIANHGTVSRFGGDEFNILLEDIIDEEDAIDFAGRIRESLMQPFELEGHQMAVSTSIGIVLNTATSMHPDRLLQSADTALYQAKLKGKDTYEIFDRKMHEKVLERLQLEIDLRQSLAREELEVYYQPIVTINSYTNTITLQGFEALVRWHHPQRGCISPGCFIPIAEEIGFITDLGWWVLSQACLQLKKWQTTWHSGSGLTMNVNLSSKQFLQSDLLEQIDRILEETNVERKHLNLEITESTIMNNTESTRLKLKQLNASGVRLSLDDFGTGYSSLSYLHRFPIDTVKIDRSFVQPLSETGDNTEIVEAIIVLARKLGMDVVAEGVENRSQLQQLRSLGCHRFQGYLFSRPLSSEQVDAIWSHKYKKNDDRHGQDRKKNPHFFLPTAL